MTSKEGVPVSVERLMQLRWNPLTDVFVEGMRSPEPKSKFLFWFVMLEELEKCEEFTRLFSPLFTPAQASTILDITSSVLDSGAQNRIQQFFKALGVGVLCIPE
jgi:hypothetical protein